MNEQFEGVDRQFDKEVSERDRALIKQPFDHEKEVDKRPELSYYNYDQ